jgi:hypothetical protein
MLPVTTLGAHIMARTFFTDLWKSSPILTGTALGMLGVLLISLLGLVLDPRTIGGVPAWLKPAKFAVSTAIYSLTLAWIFRFVSNRPKLTRVVGRTTGIVFIVEVGLIAVQAIRGVGSHFNIATPIDAAIFSTMGVLILIVWAASVALTVALFRQRFDDATLGWAVRLGLLISVMGAATGGLMTRPTAEQLARVRETREMPVAGAHTVGAIDGGPGLPGTGWSLEHGDLRVPHFLGLHAVQVLPIFAIALGRVRAGRSRRRGVVVAAVSYLTLLAVLLGQALIGQSVFAPAGIVLTLLVAWAGLTTLAMIVALTPHAWATPRNMEARVL